MKRLLIVGLFLGAFSSYGNTLETFLRCEQHDDADQWLEVGLTINDGPGYQLFVVKHDYDTKAKELILSKKVFLSKCSNNQKCYKNTMDTLKLTSTSKTFETADLISIVDGPAEISLKKMSCFKDHSIISFN